MRTPQNQLYLTGFMGCGKSTYGKELSQLLQMPFYDLDAEIEAAAGKPIPGIFKAYGEDYFRELESTQLKKFTKDTGPFVLATGGGTPCYFNNSAFMQENGLVIYLKASAEKLHKRLQNQRQQRPLLSEIPDKELFQYIRQTLTARSGFYALADIVIDPTYFTPKHFCELFSNSKSNHH